MSEWLKEDESAQLRELLSKIGKAGGVASGASRRAIRERAEAGELTAEEQATYDRRREQLSRAGVSRWTKK
jgi:hypothetical protein